jgi:hypothetical protein
MLDVAMLRDIALKKWRRLARGERAWLICETIMR